MTIPLFATTRYALARLGLACLLAAASTGARADLMLHPTRIVFEKGMQSAQIDLINNGSEPATYRLRLVNRRMAETGEFTSADTPLAGELFAEPLLRFSPRQVTVAPGGSQTVRVMLRKSAALADGEYRSHLQFDRVAQEPATQSAAPTPDSSAPAKPEIGIALTALVGASIPVIVRQGATSAQVTLSDLRFDPASKALSLLIARSGNASVYGDLGVTFAPNGAGQARGQVGSMGGIAVYTPNPRRRASLPLTAPPGQPLQHGVLTVSYRARAEQGGALLASAELILP